MEAKNCRVSVFDMEDIAHTVEVTAATLYEAVAIALRTIRNSEWAGTIPAGLNRITVSVKSVPVEHTLEMKQFNKWLEKVGGSPADLTHRKRVRRLLEG